MTPPVDPESLAQAGVSGSPAVFACLHVLRKRAEFLRTASALRQGTTGFMLQARKRQPDEAGDGIRVGFTCSKKVGNAVTRNRAKRRLREIARRVLPRLGRAGWDYVLVGRPGVTTERDFAAMVQDLERALGTIHAGRDA
jgi:ribonuclease P protein component